MIYENMKENAHTLYGRNSRVLEKQR